MARLPAGSVGLQADVRLTYTSSKHPGLEKNRLARMPAPPARRAVLDPTKKVRPAGTGRTEKLLRGWRLSSEQRQHGLGRRIGLCESSHARLLGDGSSCQVRRFRSEVGIPNTLSAADRLVICVDARPIANCKEFWPLPTLAWTTDSLDTAVASNVTAVSAFSF